MAQTRIVIAKTVYHTGDSWYHFNVEFENTIKVNGLASVFGIDKDPFAIVAPTRTPAVCKMMDYKAAIAYNDNLMKNYVDQTQPHPILAEVIMLTYLETKEYNEWIKEHSSYKVLCVKAFNLLKDSFDNVIWADIINEFGAIHDEESRDVTFTYFNFIKRKYGPPTSVQIKRNRDLIDAIPAFKNWRQSLSYLARFQDLINERQSWALTQPSINQLTDDDKVNWLMVRLVDDAFHPIKNVISLLAYAKTATWDDCRNKVGITIHMLQAVADLPVPGDVDIAMVTQVDPKIFARNQYKNSSTSNVSSIPYKPTHKYGNTSIVCHKCNGMNHKAEHCLYNKDLGQLSENKVYEHKKPIFEKAQFKRSSYDPYSPKTTNMSRFTPAESLMRPNFDQRKQNSNHRKPSSLSYTQYEALKKKRTNTSAAYEAYEASMAEEMEFFDGIQRESSDDVNVRLHDDLQEENSDQGGVDLTVDDNYD